MNIYFDIETAPLPISQLKSSIPEFDVTKYPPLAPFDESTVKYGNTTDPEKKKAKLHDAKLKHAQSVMEREQKIKDAQAAHEAKYLDGAALKPTTGMVLIVIVRKDGKNTILHRESEADLLEDWWRALNANYQSGHQFIGFNIFGFDLPFLVRRSWHLGVIVPHWIRNKRYWSEAFTDLMDWWQMGNRTDFISLDAFDRYTGGEGKSDTGANFHIQWNEDREKAEQYAYNDVEILERLARRLGIEDRKREDALAAQPTVPQSLTVTGCFGEGTGVVWDS